MVGRVAFCRSAPIRRRVLGLVGRERSQAERRQELALQGGQRNFRPAGIDQRIAEAPEREDLVRPAGCIHPTRLVIDVDDFSGLLGVTILGGEVFAFLAIYFAVLRVLDPIAVLGLLGVSRTYVARVLPGRARRVPVTR